MALAVGPVLTQLRSALSAAFKQALRSATPDVLSLLVELGASSDLDVRMSALGAVGNVIVDGALRAKLASDAKALGSTLRTVR